VIETRRRPPWWAYAVPLFVLNVLRQLLVPPAEVGDAVSIALFLATVSVVAVSVTLAYRMASRRAS
jgi:hypothetical protein